MAQHVAQGCLVQPDRADLASVGFATHTNRRLDIMVDHVAGNTLKRAAAVKDQLDRRTDLLVRIERDLA